MEQWYKPDDVRQELELPNTFNIEKKLGPQITKIIRYQLPGILPAVKSAELLAWFNADELDTTTDAGKALKSIYDEVFLYIVYSAWAAYHIDGYLDYSNTGPVQKLPDNSVTISGQQRTEIRVRYEGYAAIHAAKIQQLLTTSVTSCVSSYPGAGRVNISKAEGKKPYKF